MQPECSRLCIPCQETILIEHPDSDLMDNAIHGLRQAGKIIQAVRKGEEPFHRLDAAAFICEWHALRIQEETESPVTKLLRAIGRRLKVMEARIQRVIAAEVAKRG